MADLSDKQERFCQEYVVDMNATAAAIRAGYKANAAGAQASRLLTKVNIQHRIGELREKLGEKTMTDAERVILEYKKIAFAHMPDFMEDDYDIKMLNNIDPDKVGAIGSVKVKETTFGEKGTERTIEFRLHDKIRALESLSKHLGLFEEHNKQKAGFEVPKPSARKNKT